MADLSSRVGDEEQVARFILFKRWVRSSDQTVRQDAFLPPPNKELSVTRHKDLSAEKLWKHGKSVADQISKTLYGRGDVRVSDVREREIDVIAHPLIGENENHACLVGWPPDKPGQKTIAQQLAASAHYVAFEE